MPTVPFTELNSRAREIFRLVVEGYIASGQPVGSKTLAGARMADGGALNLSPASIRSVLHDLEMAGLLAAPHPGAPGQLAQVAPGGMAEEGHHQ